MLPEGSTDLSGFGDRWGLKVFGGIGGCIESNDLVAMSLTEITQGKSWNWDLLEFLRNFGQKEEFAHVYSCNIHFLVCWPPCKAIYLYRPEVKTLVSEGDFQTKDM